MSSQRRCFMTDSLHETTITRKHIGVVIHKIGTESFAKIALSNGHSYRVGKSLTQRTSCYFNTIRVSDFGVAWSL